MRHVHFVLFGIFDIIRHKIDYIPWIQHEHTEIISQIRMWRSLAKINCRAFLKRQNLHFSFQKYKNETAQEIGIYGKEFDEYLKIDLVY